MTDWSKLRVAPSRTHHLYESGAPAYEARFDDVLKYHAPGLAPVLLGEHAWHIHTDGTPAYDARYIRTFGFYEGLAAVHGEEGWFHIEPSGAAAYARRHAWCGNFQQGRCTVRGEDGRYHHITPSGAAVYEERWRYAGDYRDGVAVVQAESGLSTHITRDGALLHDAWFVDLDVFHKGFARARDEDGWMHVDMEGRPVYTRRFYAIEPFYNGQARVERFDGALEVIDEAGEALVELRPPRRDPLHQVSAELVSFWRCEAIFAAVELGIFDKLPLRDPRPRVRQLLEALGELNLVQVSDGAWTVTRAGTLLRSEHPRSLVAAARYWSGAGRRGWDNLRDAIDTPDWTPRDPFVEAASDPASTSALQSVLGTYAENDYADIHTLIDETKGVLLDAGGGTGTIARILARANPGLSTIVLERPEVAELGCVPDDLEGRLAFVGADLFQPWPHSGDAVVMARVLHDWEDEKCVTLLRHAREALPRGGRIYLVELVRRPDSFDAGLLSLHLLVTSGGMERTADHYERLLASGGFKLLELRRSQGVSNVIVAEAV